MLSWCAWGATLVNGQITVVGDVYPTTPAPSGGSWNLGGQDLWIGDFAAGSLTVNGGSVTSGGGHVGLFDDGVVSLTGAGSRWTISQGGLELGVWGRGELSILNGATVDIDGNLNAVLDPFASAAIRVDGEGSLLDVDGSLRFLMAGVGPNPELMIGDGATLRVAGGIDLLDPAMLQWDGGTIEVGGRLTGFTGPLASNQALMLTTEDAVWDLTAPTNIAGVLSGLGTIGGDATVLSGGTLRPGTTTSPFGSLMVDGDLTFESGSRIELTAGRLGEVSRSWGTIDVLGAATVQGGTVNIATVDEVPVGVECRFLRTDDSLTVDTEFQFTKPARYDITTGYDADDYWFLLTHNPEYYDLIAETPNQDELTDYLREVAEGATPGSDIADVINELNRLPEDQFRDALDQMSGESHGSTGTQSVINSSIVINTVMDQMRPSASGFFSGGDGFGGGEGEGGLGDSADGLGLGGLDDDCLCRCTCDKEAGEVCSLCGVDCTPGEPEGLGMKLVGKAFLRGFGQGGSIVGDGNARTIHNSFGGFAMGFQRDYDRYTSTGGFWAYGRSHTNVPSLRSSSETDTHWLGVVHSHIRPNQAYYLGNWTLGFDQHRSNRRIAFGSIDRTATSHSDGWQSILYGEFGFLEDFGSLSAQTYFGTQYSYIRQNGTVEGGANSLNLDVGGMDMNSMRTLVGTRWQWRTDLQRRYMPDEVELRALWTHELLDNFPPGFHGTFDPIGGSGYEARGVSPTRDWGTLGVSGRWNWRRSCHFVMDYDSQFSSRQTFHTASIGLELNPVKLPTRIRFAGTLVIAKGKD